MATEIERKFLVNHTVWKLVRKPAATHYSQGYFLTLPEKTIRVRVAGDNAFLTIKGESKGISRSEFEYEIPVADAVQMLHEFAGNTVEKFRYKIKFGNHIWEVDEFLDQNEGLIVAEIELQDEDESFEKPQWLGEEVSSDIRYFNSYLSQHPYSQWGK